MAAGRSLKTLVGRRRRLDEEGEDDEGPVMVDDSQSEGSVLTEMDERSDDEETRSAGDGQAVQGANGNAVEEKREGSANGTRPGKKSRKPRNKGGKKERGESADGVAEQGSLFQATADTEAMMKGMNLEDTGEGAIQFGDMDEPVHIPSGSRSQAGNGRAERPVDRQRREHQEYKQKRSADPAFIPNRGNFFMHDTRGAPNGQGPPPTRGALARGRGRGIPQVGASGTPPNPAQRQDKASEMPWKHDLHEVINEESGPGAQNKPAVSQQQQRDDASRLSARHALPTQASRPGPPPTLSFDVTIPVAKGQARVFLPGMKTAKMGSELSIKKYIRLPNHRPPLRRDKPVRVFIPGLGPRYIFPSMERSFIFIPRQMRPNQRGFGSSNYHRNTGGYGYSSRRTSMYGGSMYSASVAPSRRSSIARDNTFSPVSFASGFGGQARPVVRLPYNGQVLSTGTSPAGPLSGHQTPTGQVLHTYPLPQNAPLFNTPMSTVHQPRPQKQFSVTGIESPAVLHQSRTPTDEQQPFQNQLPTHMAEQSAGSHQAQVPFYPQQPHYAYQNQSHQAATPLSGIPENAMNSQAFQQPSMYYPQYPPQHGMYYPQPMQMYMPPSQGYMAPPQQPLSQPQHDQTQAQEGQREQREDAAPSGMVAHESNGMVFYIPASEAQQQPSQEHYQPAESFVPSYAMPGLPPPTPAPEATYYYPMDMQQAMYYPQQQPQQ